MERYEERFVLWGSVLARYFPNIYFGAENVSWRIYSTGPRVAHIEIDDDGETQETDRELLWTTSAFTKIIMFQKKAHTYASFLVCFASWQSTEWFFLSLEDRRQSQELHMPRTSSLAFEILTLVLLCILYFYFHAPLGFISISTHQRVHKQWNKATQKWCGRGHCRLLLHGTIERGLLGTCSWREMKWVTDSVVIG